MNSLPEPLRNEHFLRRIFLILSACLIIFFFIPLYGVEGNYSSYARLISEGSGMMPSVTGFVIMLFLPVIMVVLCLIRPQKQDLFLLNIVPAVIYLVVLAAAPGIIIRAAIKKFGRMYFGGYTQRAAIRYAASQVRHTAGFAFAMIITLLLIALLALVILVRRANGESLMETTVKLGESVGQLGRSVGDLGSKMFKGTDSGQGRQAPGRNVYQSRQDAARDVPKTGQGSSGNTGKPEVASPRIAFCSQCGSPLKEGVRFCSKCGKQIWQPGQ